MLRITMVVLRDDDNSTAWTVEDTSGHGLTVEQFVAWLRDKAGGDE